MAKMDEIKKLLIGVIQKEIDTNVADQEKARQDFETKRGEMDQQAKELESLELIFLDAQTTGRKLSEVYKEVQNTFPDPPEKTAEAIAAEAEATPEVRK